MQLEHDLRQCLETADRLQLRVAAIRINEALEELKAGPQKRDAEKRSRLVGGARD